MQSNLRHSENQTCPHCKSINLYAEDRPPHVALMCGSCHRWLAWIPKSKAADYPTKPAGDSSALKLAEEPPTTQATRQDFTTSGDLLTRVDRLETEVEKINRELAVYNRIFGTNSRRPRQEFNREITDEMIADFNQAVGGER